MHLPTLLLSFTSLVYASQFSIIDTLPPESHLVESLVLGREMQIGKVVQSIMSSLSSELAEKMNPLDVIFKEPVGESLVPKIINLTLFSMAFEEQCKMLQVDHITTPTCDFLSFTYHEAVFTEKTADKNAKLVIVRQPAIGILHSIAEITKCRGQ